MEFYVLLPEFLGICKDGNVFYKLSSFQPITVVFPKDLSKTSIFKILSVNYHIYREYTQGFKFDSFVPMINYYRFPCNV
jgi:hypothetical protein